MRINHLLRVAVRIAVTGLLAGCFGDPSTRPDEIKSFVVLEINSSVREDVCPFTVTLEAAMRDGDDSIKEVSWDFDNDGAQDATGPVVTHTFEEPLDYVVTAVAELASGEEAVASTMVSGYAGLMTLTFDDGLASAYDEALPALNGEGVTATAYIIVTFINSSTQYMTWDEVHALQDAGWDIGSHTMTHPRLPEVTEQQLQAELRDSQYELQKLGFPAKHFALPYGASNAKVNAAVMQYYSSNRACGDAMNPLPEKADASFLLCFSTDKNTALSTYQSQIDEAVKGKRWYILNNHTIESDCGSKFWCAGGQTLVDTVRYAKARRLKIVNVEEALTGSWKNPWMEHGDDPVLQGRARVDGALEPRHKPPQVSVAQSKTGR